MTCIIGLEKDGVVYLAGDRLGSDGFTKIESDRPKVFQNGYFLIGYTSSFRMGQLLQYEWSPPVELRTQDDPDLFVFTSVIDSIRDLFKRFDWEHGHGECKGGEFLLGYRGRLYKVLPNYAVLRSPRGYVACGSGEYHAEATLKTLLDNTEFPPEQVLTQAINNASYFVTSVNNQVDIIKEGE